jgi:hypothetical protein
VVAASPDAGEKERAAAATNLEERFGGNVVAAAAAAGAAHVVAAAVRKDVPAVLASEHDEVGRLPRRVVARAGVAPLGVGSGIDAHYRSAVTKRS